MNLLSLLGIFRGGESLSELARRREFQLRGVVLFAEELVFKELEDIDAPLFKGGVAVPGVRRRNTDEGAGEEGEVHSAGGLVVFEDGSRSGDAEQSSGLGSGVLGDEDLPEEILICTHLFSAEHVAAESVEKGLGCEFAFEDLLEFLIGLFLAVFLEVTAGVMFEVMGDAVACHTDQSGCVPCWHPAA